MSNEKVLAALFERIEIGKSHYFESLLSSKGMEITLWLTTGPFLGCGEKTASLASFTGKWCLETINSTLILKLTYDNEGL